MSADGLRRAEPSAAERVRTVVAAAGSLTVTMGRRRWELTGTPAPHGGGRLLLRVPAGSGLAEAVARARRPALLEFTDVAPTAVRDRVRARVTVIGWPDLTGPLPGCAGLPRTAGVRLDPSHIVLGTPAGRVVVGLDEFTLADADPLATREAGLLTHMADHHADVVELLTRLLDPRLLQTVTAVRPLALDRYGITLRCEYARAHRDVRLPFTAPLPDADQAGPAMRALMAAALARPCRRHRLTPP